VTQGVSASQVSLTAEIGRQNARDMAFVTPEISSQPFAFMDAPLVPNDSEEDVIVTIEKRMEVADVDESGPDSSYSKKGF
jgi:hypothetical protein